MSALQILLLGPLHLGNLQAQPTDTINTLALAVRATCSALSNLQPSNYQQHGKNMKVAALVATGAAVMTALPVVQGHAYIVDPAAQWTQGYPSNGYASTIDSSIWGAIDGGKYGYGPSGTIKFWKAMFPQKGGGSMSALIAKNQKLYSNEVDPECGLTTYKESARSKLPAEIEWSGFTHPGPCEVWCDDTKVLFDYDCQTTYSSIPAMVPLDGKCASANRLTVYWIAVHGNPWQVYTDCVWLEGGSGKGSAPSGAGGSSTVSTVSNSTSSTTTDAPSSNTNLTPSTGTTPTATTASTSSEQGASIAGEASSAVEEYPSTPITADTTTTEKCNRSRH